MKLRGKHILRTSLLLGGVAAIGGIGTILVSADTTSASTTTKNGIARYTVQYDRLNAVAEVLNTTPTNLENELKTQTMAQVIKAAGFTPASFRQKVKAQLQTDLQNQGYSQTQIINALAKHHGKHKKA